MRRVREVRRFVRSNLTCKGEVGTTERVMDPETLEYVEQFVPVWSGPCLVYPQDLDPRNIIAGEQEFTVSRYTVILPAEADVETGQTFRATASPDEPDLVGLNLHLVDVPLNAWSVARQCVAARTV